MNFWKCVLLNCSQKRNPSEVTITFSFIVSIQTSYSLFGCSSDFFLIFCCKSSVQFHFLSSIVHYYILQVRPAEHKVGSMYRTLLFLDVHLTSKISIPILHYFSISRYWYWSFCDSLVSRKTAASNARIHRLDKTRLQVTVAAFIFSLQQPLVISVWYKIAITSCR